MVDFQADDASGDARWDAARDENAERRERVVEAVLQRIEVAPRVTADSTATASRARVDIGTWRVHALAAAAVVMIASGAIILATDQPLPPEAMTASPGALPAPVARYLQTGVVSPMEWLNSYGGRP